MRKNLEILVSDKTAVLKHRDDYAICGNSDYSVTFSFDSEWNSFEYKTVRFRYNDQHIDILMPGNTCAFPVIQNAEWVEIGVFAGDLCTTTPVRLPMRRSILCRGGRPASPMANIYSQLLETLTGKADRKQSASNAGKLWQVGQTGDLQFCEKPEPFSIHAQTAGASLADSDELAFYDGTAAQTKKITWANIKTAVSGLFPANVLTSMKLKLAGAAQTPDADGYVDVPIASNTAPGIMKVGLGTMGLNLYNNEIYTVKAPIAQIRSRNTPYSILSPDNYDQAVKHAMCDTGTASGDTLGASLLWTDAEKTGAWVRLHSVKTAMDAVAVAGAQYYLGTQSTVTITLPSTAITGQEILVSWQNGVTGASLSISGNALIPAYEPTGFSVSTVTAVWDGLIWNVEARETLLSRADVLGLEVDYENSTFTRLEDAVGKVQGADFDSFAPFGGRRRCNVANDGTINAYYGDPGYTEDGSNGQVMVYQPKFYYAVVPVKLEPNTTSGIGYHIRKARYYISATKYPGFKLHPAFVDGNGNEVNYILLSAYEGSMWDASQNKYINDSVDESIAYAAGDLLCSVAGKKPISGLRTGMGTKANFEAMSNNRGAGWHLETIKATSANQLLMMIEIGMMNTQTGIGDGVTSIAEISSYNCSSLTGSTGSLGNGTGSAASTINEKGGVETIETASSRVSVTYRGVENPWGNIYKHIQGVNIWGDGSMAGGQPFVCDNLTDFNESSHSGHYEGAGFTIPNASGYIKAIGYGNPDFDWLLMPSEIGGDSSLPVGDYCYVTADLNGYRIFRFGGVWGNGDADGGFCWRCIDGVGGRARSIGGRLLYVPTA